MFEYPEDPRNPVLYHTENCAATAPLTHCGYAAEAAIELDPANAQHHLQSAHATGRYSQLLAPMKSMREGHPKKVRALIERALELDPSHFGAHLSLASCMRKRSAAEG